MDESKRKPEEAVPVKKKKRQFILSVLIIALNMILFGQTLGNLILLPVKRLFPAMSPSWSFLLQYLSFIGIVVLVLLYCALAEKPTFRSFRSAGHGGGRGNTLREFALGILIGFLMNGACILVAWLHGDLDFSVGRFDLLYMLVAFACVLVQSGAEELVTRGYILGVLRERYSIWIALAANSLLFGFLHLFNNGITVLSMVNIILIGFALSLVVWLRGSLWMAVAVHTMWNYTQNFLFGLPNSGIVSQGSFLHLEAARGSVFYDAVFGVEGTLTAVLVEGLLCVGVWLLARKKSAGGQD